MRLCPTCGNRYSDDTLKFCLQDGTPLSRLREGELPTAVLNEVETAVARGQTDGPGSGWQAGHNPYATRTSELKKGSNTALAVAVTAIGMLLLFGVVGIAAWLYTRSTQPEVEKNNGNLLAANANIAVNSTPVRNANGSATRTPTPPVNNITPPDDSRTRAEVLARLDSWKSQSESLDLDAYMQHYASTVDYYNKTGASAAFVRSDKQRAFTRFSSISINLSNISVTTGDAGETATVLFDKEWDFRGNSSSSGKVRQMLRLERIGGQWLITAEKDLKLYYKG